MFLPTTSPVKRRSLVHYCGFVCLVAIFISVSGCDRDPEVTKLIHDLMEQLSPAARMVITLLDIEGRSVKEIANLTGWSLSLVKVRAFRARKEMRKLLEKMNQDQYL